MSFRVDFHTHTGHSADSLLPAARLLDAAIRRGLAGLAVTDHNTLGGALQAQSLVERQPERYPGLVVIPGEEVMTAAGEVIGLLLSEPIPRGLPAEETIARIHDQGGLALVPHPFDRLRGSRLRTSALERVAHLIDAIEVFNARTTLPGDNALALAFARARRLPAVAGSDTHVVAETGSAYVELDEPPALDARRLLDQIRRGRVGGRKSWPTVHVGSKLARWRKQFGLAPVIQL